MSARVDRYDRGGVPVLARLASPGLFASGGPVAPEPAASGTRYRLSDNAGARQPPHPVPAEVSRAVHGAVPPGQVTAATHRVSWPDSDGVPTRPLRAQSPRPAGADRRPGDHPRPVARPGRRRGWPAGWPCRAMAIGRCWRRPPPTQRRWRSSGSGSRRPRAAGPARLYRRPDAVPDRGRVRHGMRDRAVRGGRGRLVLGTPGLDLPPRDDPGVAGARAGRDRAIPGGGGRDAADDEAGHHRRGARRDGPGDDRGGAHGSRGGPEIPQRPGPDRQAVRPAPRTGSNRDAWPR